MINLLKETIDILQENDKTINDIEWIANGSVEIPIATFIDKANKEYDDGFGGTEVIESLIVVGKDWWLERHEYDGSEWWEFKTLPTRPSEISETAPIFYSWE